MEDLSEDEPRPYTRMGCPVSGGLIWPEVKSCGWKGPAKGDEGGEAGAMTRARD